MLMWTVNVKVPAALLLKENFSRKFALPLNVNNLDTYINFGPHVQFSLPASHFQI